LTKEYELTKSQLEIEKHQLTKQVHKAYFEIVYAQQLIAHFRSLDSMYTAFEYAATRRFEQGEANYMEKLTIETSKEEIDLKLRQLEEQVTRGYLNLRKWMQTDTRFSVSETSPQRLELTPLDSLNHPAIQYYQSSMLLSEQQHELEKKQLLPDLHGSAFLGSNFGDNGRLFPGFELGVGVPLWRASQRAKIASAKTEQAIIATEMENFNYQLAATYEALQSQLKQYEEGLLFYETTGKKFSEETYSYAYKAYEGSEINFSTYTQLLEKAQNNTTTYLQTLFQYNMTVLEANFLMND